MAKSDALWGAARVSFGGLVGSESSKDLHPAGIGSTDLDQAVRQFPWRDLAWWQLRFSPCSFDVIPPTSSTSWSVASTEYTLTTLNPTPLPQPHSAPLRHWVGSNDRDRTAQRCSGSSARLDRDLTSTCPPHIRNERTREWSCSACRASEGERERARVWLPPLAPADPLCSAANGRPGRSPVPVTHARSKWPS